MEYTRNGYPDGPCEPFFLVDVHEEHAQGVQRRLERSTAPSLIAATKLWVFMALTIISFLALYHNICVDCVFSDVLLFDFCFDLISMTVVG